MGPAGQPIDRLDVIMEGTERQLPRGSNALKRRMPARTYTMDSPLILPEIAEAQSVGSEQSSIKTRRSKRNSKTPHLLPRRIKSSFISGNRRMPIKRYHSPLTVSKNDYNGGIYFGQTIMVS